VVPDHVNPPEHYKRRRLRARCVSSGSVDLGLTDRRDLIGEAHWLSLAGGKSLGHLNPAEDTERCQRQCRIREG